MLATTTQTVKPSQAHHQPTPASPSPVMVTLAYAWGFEDGGQGKRFQPSAYFTFNDPQYGQYVDGYHAGERVRK